jgi:hypothetical protein
MPLLARRAASATERTLVYFRMNMYIRPPMRLSSSPTHQSISGRCWTRAYFRDGSFTTELGILRDVRFTSVSNRTADIVAGPVRADTVAKVENRTRPKISRMLIIRPFCRCGAL